MKELVIVRGGGDIASGIIWTLRNAGFHVLVLEQPYPSAIRLTVSFCNAVYEGSCRIEGLACIAARKEEEAFRLLSEDGLAVLTDPAGECLRHFLPDKNWQYSGFRLTALVDAILAKYNTGTHMGMAPFVAALGPGFTPGEDCHAAVETMRGHDLGRILYDRCPQENTGVPGMIAGHAADRVIHAPADGRIRHVREIGDIAEAGEIIAQIERADAAEEPVPVRAPFKGLIRGLIHEGYPVQKGLKIADIDPRESELKNCFTISDKARCIGGAVLTAVMKHVSEGKV
ncbi:MAG: EF2563 family selenium-dependent molybdenum hydroxylase system protein [Lachnospiraceae bacterium]|nr:EF2563 family selenium-dependent molybdenum hydroxylase system protein [Lachnospiraceae bacterium]